MHKTRTERACPFNYQEPINGSNSDTSCLHMYVLRQSPVAWRNRRVLGGILGVVGLQGSHPGFHRLVPRGTQPRRGRHCRGLPAALRGWEYAVERRRLPTQYALRLWDQVLFYFIFQIECAMYTPMLFKIEGICKDIYTAWHWLIHSSYLPPSHPVNVMYKGQT